MTGRSRRPIGPAHAGRVAIQIAIALLVGGCGASKTTTIVQQPPALPVTSPVTAASARPRVSAATPSARPRGSATTAASVVNALRDAGLPISGVVVYTASSDPNHLLGRPAEYTSKAAFTDRRINPAEVADAAAGSIDLGGGVEVFTDSTAARSRAEYISSLEQATPVLGSEYDYLAGRVLLRISSRLTPAQAERYGQTIDARLQPG
jgi:hypothetical protein